MSLPSQRYDHHFVLSPQTVSRLFVLFVTNGNRKYKSIQTFVFLKLLVKQNSAIGASAPLIHPVMELIGGSL